MSPLSSSTVTAFGNYFCVCILFYSFFSLPLPFPHHFIQNKTSSSWVPVGLSKHCTGSNLQCTPKREGKTFEGLHQETKDAEKISDSSFFRCWRVWGWRKCRSIMAETPHSCNLCNHPVFRQRKSYASWDKGFWRLKGSILSLWAQANRVACWPWQVAAKGSWVLRLFLLPILGLIHPLSWYCWCATRVRSSQPLSCVSSLVLW